MAAITRKAALVKGALTAYLKPKLALDAKLNLSPLVRDVTQANWATSKPKLVAALRVAAKPKLAADADIEDVVQLLDTLDDVTDEVADIVESEPAAPKPAEDDDDAVMAKIAEVLKAKGMSDEDIAAVMAALKDDAPPPPKAAEDADKDKDEKKMPPAPTKAAMDAAIKLASDANVKRAVAETIAHQNAIRDAEREVRPYVGEIVAAMDSAEAVYHFALDSMGVAGAKDVNDLTALRLVLSAQPKPGDKQMQRPARVAMDASADAEFHKKFPGAAALKHR